MELVLLRPRVRGDSVAAPGLVGPDRHANDTACCEVRVGLRSGIVNRLAAWIMVGAFLELGLVALWFAAGSGRQRRSYFWVRVLLAALALPGYIGALAGIGRLRVLSLSDDAAKALLPFLVFVGVIILMFVPGVLYRGSDPSPGPSEPDGGGGPQSRATTPLARCPARRYSTPGC